MSKKIIIIGGGGHASVLIDILKKNKQCVYAFVSPNVPHNREIFSGINHWRSDSYLMSLDPNDYLLINGIGATPKSSLRNDIELSYKTLGFQFISVISSHACISDHAVIGQSVQIMPGAIINPGCKISDNVIVNSGAVIEHDCLIGEQCHIAPRAVLCGGVTLGKRVYVGANSTIIQGMNIPDKTIVGAGVVINKPFKGNTIFYPARPYLRRMEDDN